MNAIITRIAAALVSVVTTFVLFNAVVSLSEPHRSGAQVTHVARAANSTAIR
ncbi:MAG TPA: hypothetical protein VFR86_07610 [Burkholderiaceae bacterium]|nr:hypothetical protein [Burkholderiaceae bacterium]